MTDTQYNEQLELLDKQIDAFDDEIDAIQDKKRELYQEKHKLERLYHSEKMASLKIQPGNVIFGVAKRKDYHFMMLKAFVVSKASSAHHIDVIAHMYACDDFEYSFRGYQQNISIDNVIDMFKDFHLYVLSMDTYKELLIKMTMLEINIDNFEKIAATYTLHAMQKIND